MQPVRGRASVSGGVRSAVLFAVGALVIAGAGGALAAWESRDAARRAEEVSQANAMEVARKTAAAINVGMENAVVLLDTVANSTGLESLLAGGDAQLDCEQRLAALSGQGFSFLLIDGDGQVVCAVGEGPEEDSSTAAGLSSVQQWLSAGGPYEQLGVIDEPLVDGRMTFDPGGQVGLATVAVPVGDGAAAAWIDSWQAFTPPMDAAIASPGIDAVIAVDEAGRVVVPAPSLIDGQPLTGRARPFDDGSVLVEPQPETIAYSLVDGLRAGVVSGVIPSSQPDGGVARGPETTRWVSVPVPRLGASVAVAWDESDAAALWDRSTVVSVWAAVVMGLVAMAVLGWLWWAVAHPLSRLAGEVRASAGGPVAPTVGGPAEVRSLQAAVVEYSGSWVRLAEVAGAARERERTRLVDLLNGDVSQRVAAAALMVRDDPDGAQAELRAASARLGEVTEAMEPAPVPGGGLGAALVAYGTGAGSWLSVDDSSSGRRLDAIVERLMYRSVLEVLAQAELRGCQVSVDVDIVDDNVQVTITALSDVRCPGLDDVAYWDDHELVAAGGMAVVHVSDDGSSRQVVLRGPSL